MLFKEKLKSKNKIFLDGGNGSEIAKLGGDMSPAFSALATITSGLNFLFKIGKLFNTASLPERPTMSPINIIFI